MSGNPEIWLEWKGRKEAEAEAMHSVPYRIQYAHSIGQDGFGNAVVWGDCPDAVRFASLAVKTNLFDFAYVNPETACLGRKTEAGWLSALLQILIYVKRQMSEKGILVLRPLPYLFSEMVLVLKEAFPDWDTKALSVKRGYEGFTELAAACSPLALNAPKYNWNLWSRMVEQCCPENGKALFAGLDEASSGFIGCARTRNCIGSRKCGMKAAFVFPMESAAKGCPGYRQNAADAWEEMQECAARREFHFGGLDTFEMCSAEDGTAGSRGSSDDS